MISALFKTAIEQSLSEKLKTNVYIKNFTPVSGGCINDAHRIDIRQRTDSPGRKSAGVFFIKWNVAKKYPAMFEAEAKGLSLLSSTQTLKIPEVILCDETEGKSYLVLEYIETGKRQKDFWEYFGKKLAALHKHTSTSFGLDHNNYIGSLPQSNHQQKSWIDFFIEERLGKQITLAKDSGAISNSTIQQFNNLYKKLHDIIPEENPSLLHGDLWNGNYMIAQDGAACLIDPAVYYGHREMDLAMTRLFGGFSEEFYKSYQEAFPLVAGFESRVDIHNLYPLLVHVNLFGGGYLSQVKAILSRFS